MGCRTESLFDDNDEPDRYYVARAKKVKVWEAGGTNGRVRYDAGDLEIEVDWYCRDISGGDERRVFKNWEGVCGKSYSFNSTELRAINLEMQPLPPVGGVPLEVVRRQPSRAAAGRAMGHIRGILRCVRQEHADPPEQLWELSAASEGRVLLCCCR